MDNLSHSRHPIRSASSKLITPNGGGSLAKSLYDDVYGGPPKFGHSSSSSLSPRLEDYSEIFGAFGASRASSIPVLELPAVVDGGASEEFFDVRSSGFDYSEVFGGFDGLDFAVAYDDLVKQQSNGGDGGSSDEAWTPVGSGSVSGESNHSAKNQRFSDEDPYYSFDGSSEFGISYNKVHHKSSKESLNGRTRANPVPASSGYRYVPDEITPEQQTKFDNPGLQVTDDRKLNMDSNVEMGNEKRIRKTVSLPLNGSSAGQAYGDSYRPERGSGRNGSRRKEPFVTISDISLRTHPSHLPPPCRPPPIVDGNGGDSGRLSSNSNTVSSDERTGDSSPRFFDVEVDASSSAAVSAAAMKEAMEKARVQLRSAKELMQRKKEGFHSHSKSRSKKENKEEGKVGKVADGSSSKKDDRVQATSKREDSRMKSAGSEETQNVLNKVRENPESLVDGKSLWAAGNLVQEKHGKGSWSPQGSFKIDEASEWQEATQYFELVTLDDSHDTKKTFEQANKDKISVQRTNRHEHRPKDNASLEVLEKEEADINVRVGVHVPEDLEKKHHEMEESNARSKDAKESRRRKEHEKMVKVTQEASGKGDTEMSSRVGKVTAESEKRRGRSTKSERHDNMPEVHGKENKFNAGNAIQQKDKAIKIEERYDESHGIEGIEIRLETLEQEENERRLIDALKKSENENKLKQVLEQEEKEKMLKKALESQENERKSKEAREQENKRRQKEAALREDNEKKRKEVLEKEEKEKWLKEENEKRLKKTLELQENEKKLKEALEQENNMRLKEAAQREENEKRLKEALELEDYQKRQKDAREREENEQKLQMAHAREQQYATNRLKDSQEKAFKQAEIQQKLDEASVSEETERNNKSEDARKEANFPQKTQKGTKRNENDPELMSGQGTHLHMEVEDHKVSDETCNQECEENTHATQTARSHDENRETMKKSREARAHEENGVRKSDNKNSDTQSVPEIFEPINMSLDLESGEIRFRRKDANEFLPSDASVKKAREEISAEPQVRKVVLGEVETTNGPVAEKFKASGLAQGGTESGKSQFRMDDAYESIPFVNFVKKAVEASSGAEIPQPKFNCTARKDSDHGTQKMDCAWEWKEREKDLKQVHPSSTQEENLAAESVKEFVVNRRKTEAAYSAAAETNNRKSSQQVNATQPLGRKVKNLNEDLLNGEKETERLKRERELETDRLRKIEEEREREREREKDRMAVDRATLEARDWAFVEARERAERVALERATADARQRAMAEARERLEKACAEAREKSLAGKAAMEARLKAERAAVERATAEARERAAEKLMAERERVQRSVSDKFSASSRNNGLRHCSSSSDLQDQLKSRHPNSTSYGERYEGVEGESAQRCKARLERHARTSERAAQALAEKNMRDLLAQREQAERIRLAETLDADVKRWSSGKEGNLRALLSTLQYILGSDSGWQPIPLTEVITAAAVKKAYRKATLCVHPDKLQQRGANIHQKYICEKVFDLLKEAWNKFNSEER